MPGISFIMKVVSVNHSMAVYDIIGEEWSWSARAARQEWRLCQRAQTEWRCERPKCHTDSYAPDWQLKRPMPSITPDTINYVPLCKKNTTLVKHTMKGTNRKTCTALKYLMWLNNQVVSCIEWCSYSVKRKKPF